MKCSNYDLECGPCDMDCTFESNPDCYVDEEHPRICPHHNKIARKVMYDEPVWKCEDCCY